MLLSALNSTCLVVRMSGIPLNAFRCTAATRASCFSCPPASFNVNWPPFNTEWNISAAIRRTRTHRGRYVPFLSAPQRVPFPPPVPFLPSICRYALRCCALSTLCLRSVYPRVLADTSYAFQCRRHSVTSPPCSGLNLSTSGASECFHSTCLVCLPIPSGTLQLHTRVR